MPRQIFKKGDRINDIFILKKFDIRQSKNGNPYADVTLSDRNGDYTAKMWDVAAVSCDFAPGDFVAVEATAQSYNDSLQFIIAKIEPQPVPDEEKVSELVECAPYPPEKMYAKIISIVNDMENEDIKKITYAMLEENKQALMYYPAAKSFHHAVKGGLIYHTYTMMRAASVLTEIYTFLNRDLVYAGVALHDMGKIKEITSTLYGSAGEYSQEGKLLGHITIGICDIDRKAAELNIDPEVTLLLKHMVLSHHFYPEFGSPVAPMTAEAELLHHLDVIDSRMNQFEKTLAATPAGEFSDKVWILDKRSVYNTNLEADNSASEDNE